MLSLGLRYKKEREKREREQLNAHRQLMFAAHIMAPELMLYHERMMSDSPTSTQQGSTGVGGKQVVSRTKSMSPCCESGIRKGSMTDKEFAAASKNLLRRRSASSNRYHRSDCSVKRKDGSLVLLKDGETVPLGGASEGRNGGSQSRKQQTSKKGKEKAKSASKKKSNAKRRSRSDTPVKSCPSGTESSLQCVSYGQSPSPATPAEFYSPSSAEETLASLPPNGSSSSRSANQKAAATSVKRSRSAANPPLSDVNRSTDHEPRPARPKKGSLIWGRSPGFFTKRSTSGPPLDSKRLPNDSNIAKANLHNSCNDNALDSGHSTVGGNGMTSCAATSCYRSPCSTSESFPSMDVISDPEKATLKKRSGSKSLWKRFMV